MLRVAPGQVFEISDTERLYLGKVIAAKPGTVEFAIERELPAPAPLPQVTLMAAIFKFDRMDWMIEKATELGAARFEPVIAARTEKALATAAVKRVERWRRIAFEAGQQSRRLKPMEIAAAAPLAQALAQTAAGRRWMLDENPDTPRRPELLEPAAASILLVGPEGGWTDAERELAREHGFVPVGLGPLVLRAETAAIAALAVVLCQESA